MSTKLVDLGWCIGKLTKPDVSTVAPSLRVISPGSAGECYEPPSEVVICGDGIYALRDALNEAFPGTDK